MRCPSRAGSVNNEIRPRSPPLADANFAGECRPCSWSASFSKPLFLFDKVNGELTLTVAVESQPERGMEKLIFLSYPPQDIRAIESIVRASDCFVALIEGDLYQIGAHLADDEFEFSAILDRNVYTRVTALVSGEPVSAAELSEFRRAAAILAFAKIANIALDHASSLYEYANTRGGIAAVEEYYRFQRAHYCDTRAMIDFALGRIDLIPLAALSAEKKEEDAPPADEFERLTYHYRINYTFALKIAELAELPIPNVEKMLRFLDWMEFDFILGSPATLFANRYFSPSRYGKMLKGASKRDIGNATWDLTLIQIWRKSALAGLKDSKPTILITRDRAVKSMARLITAEDEDEFENGLRSPWGRNTVEGKRVVQRYMNLHHRHNAGITEGRKMPNVGAQMEIMRSLEEKLFGQADTG